MKKKTKYQKIGKSRSETKFVDLVNKYHLHFFPGKRKLMANRCLEIFTKINDCRNSHCGLRALKNYDRTKLIDAILGQHCADQFHFSYR